MQNKKTKHRITTFMNYTFLVVGLLIILFPIYYMIINSLMPSQMVMSLPVKWWPQKISFNNFIKILQNSQYINYFKNSFIAAFGCVAMSLLVAIPSAFCLSRYRFKGRSWMISAVTSVQMFPQVVIMASLYTFYLKYDMLDTYLGLILADATFAMPLTIMMLKGFYDTLPRALDEAATIDGANRMQVMIHILLPLILPGLIGVATYTFLTAWDDYLLAMIIMQSENMITLPVGLARSFVGEYSNDYGSLMAFSVAGSLPIVLLFVFFQKYLITGLTNGAVKG